MAEALLSHADPEFARWVEEIARYEEESRRWQERSRKIVKRYKDERDGPADENAQRYNILWSNLQVLIPAVYAKNPVPQVERRYRDDDPVGRQASEVLERCIAWCLAAHAFKDVARCAVLDRFLPGRGAIWVRYVPHFKDAAVAGTVEERDEGIEVTDDVGEIGAGKIDRLPGDAAADEVLDFEECIPDYVHWQDFGHTVGRTWSEVRAVWRIAYLTRSECVARFGENVGNRIPLSASQTERDGARELSRSERLDKAVIYEIWDKPSRTAYWLCKDFPEGLLDKQEDPLGLSGFFPCPRPLFATLANDSLIPVPDYVEYQDQAHELDELTARIAALTRAIKVAGVYDASQQGLDRLLSEGTENQLVPVDSWAAFAEKGGIKGAFELMPLDDIVKTLLALHEARDRVKQDLYEITGLADILRGANDPAESATATRMKGAFASIRLREVQDEVSRFVCDAVRIMGEIIAHHFGADTMARMSGVNLLTAAQKAVAQGQMQQQAMLAQQQGQQPPKPAPAQMEMLHNPSWDEVIALLKNDATRNFRIDIETDSTIADDEEQDRAERMAFLDATSSYIEKIMGAASQAPQLAPLLGEMLMFGVRGFRIGRTLENAFETALEQMQQTAQNPPPPSPPPEMVKAQAAAQIAQQKMHADAHAQQIRVQGDIQIAQAKAQSEMELERMKAQFQVQQAQAHEAAQVRQAAMQNRFEEERAAVEAQQAAKLEAMRLAMEQHQMAMQSQMQLLIVQMNNAAKIEAAEIAAGAALDRSQIAAADAAQGEA